MRFAWTKAQKTHMNANAICSKFHLVQQLRSVVHLTHTTRNENNEACFVIRNRLAREEIHLSFIYQRADLGATEVSSRPKLTGIVRGKARTSDRLPRLTQTYSIMPDVMDMIESNID
ncbi:hypothetical protein TNCV_2031921 [Trichonephila clavipes]|nr:hypothetical protein TNCV_2031921 [Trichonephila clavipes]